MLNLKAGRFALPAGIFATMLWGSQAWVAVRATPQLNFLEITLLLHAFALAGITTLNLFRLRDFVRDLKFLLRVRHALRILDVVRRMPGRLFSALLPRRCRTDPKFPA